MNLHKNHQEFYDAILMVSNKLNTSPSIVEKDYYVTMFLESLVKRVPNLLFKGGTSLSKCHKMINRFSEDIDLTLNAKNITQSNKRQLKYEIIEVCKELGLELINKEDILSRRDYNRYEIKYPIHFEETGIKQFILIETVFMVKSFPDEIKQVTSMIYEFWKEIGEVDIIEEYGMQPFKIHVQALERTLIDKVFAICDYKISDNVYGHSRHIYDLYKLLNVVALDDKLKSLIKEVREERKNSEHCYSAKDEYNISELLKQIINEKTYYKDYEEITKRVLFETIGYEEAITVLDKIIDSRVFEK